MEETKKVDYKVHNCWIFLPDKKRIKGLRHYLGYMRYIGKLKPPKEDTVNKEPVFENFTMLTGPVKGGMKIVEPA